MPATAALADPYVDTAWLAAHLADEAVRVVEVDVSPASYRQGHLPGALLWDIYTDLRHPDYLPITTAELVSLLSRSGVTPETTVVFYGYGAHLGFWLLRSHGHENVRLLAEGRTHWSDAGLDLGLDAPDPAPTSYPDVTCDPRLCASRSDVLGLLGRPGHVILDVRSQAEYDGDRFWPSGATEGAGRAGHIPGSVHLPIERFHDEAGFRPPDELRQTLAERGVTPEQRVVTYCTIGNRASQAWYALTLLGRDAAVYHGSWAEWGSLPDTPVERKRHEFIPFG